VAFPEGRCHDRISEKPDCAGHPVAAACRYASPTIRAWVASVIHWVRSSGPVGAPGGKAGHDSPSADRSPKRLAAFSDAVFAITVTLLVLDIRRPTDYRNLLHELAVLWPSYLAYAVTFLFIGQVWANHHVMFNHIRAADSSTWVSTAK
jgi:hypothetical protein